MNTLRRPAAPAPTRNVPRPPKAPPVVEAPPPPPRVEKSRPPRKKGPSIFGLIDKLLRLDSFFQEGVPVRYLPPVLWAMLLVLLYIFNSHFADRTVRRMDRVKRETEDLRADYTTLKADYMQQTVQSAVAYNVAPYGLVESHSPPYRIVLKGLEADSVIMLDPKAEERMQMTEAPTR